ncbi:uncharacterized protein TRIADDRAFT_60873 [Trichoplax adhaerens]|uniref:Fucosyltransferase N-terminal domain-containing protein n=1 Tax=Trichoplax adhaerens TaxID=10228 RepID=B3S9E1_TRIAD|nr:hypothetical protein TRIADDRAFT_60873 [Trichoplax adhaerens]EDV20684.1 hypothetical protein TRIADDRAFT_60873 [Trichoplax adhaerens]|eukprot:XP_002116884.1 hypothetical protein TRIADDRAFT_60873 [Trichoplax adhaerens]
MTLYWYTCIAVRNRLLLTFFIITSRLCEITRDHSQYKSSDIIVFHGLSPKITDQEYYPSIKTKPYQQLWVYRTMENPIATDIAPPESYINAQDFHTIEDLVNHIQNVANNNTKNRISVLFLSPPKIEQIT